MAISGYFFLRFFALVQENGVSGIATWACEIKSHILNVTRHHNSAHQVQAQDDINDVNEARSSDHNDENDHEVKVQAAD